MLTIINITVILLILNSADAANILAVFPVPSISHQVVFRPITQELAKRGHNVVVITTNPVFLKGETLPRLKEIDVQYISYKIWTETFMKASKGKKSDISTHIEIFLESFAYIIDAILQTKEVKQILNEKFDILLIEACMRPALGFSFVFKAPVVLISSFGAAPGNYELMGASEHPILYPNALHQKLYNLTAWEKIIELYGNYKTKKSYANSEILENQILRKRFGPDIPTVEELGNNVDLMLLNSNPVFDNSHPVPPNVIYMGGIHQLPSKPLPTDLQKYLDSSKNGVIYVSFGTNVDSTLLPAERIQILVSSFSKLPYDVLLKWDDEQLQGRTDNIKISKWLPQSDLLQHPKIKLFITQGGQQSTDEAITAGVPLIGIPMLGDQWYNVQKYVYHRIGEELDLETLTEEKLTNTIHTVVTDESYRKNIIRLRTLMLDQPMKPLERAIWWIEYVLRHGGAKHLRAPSANISWSQYLELELVFYILSALLFIIFVFLSFVYLLYKYIFSKSTLIKVKRK